MPGFENFYPDRQIDWNPYLTIQPFNYLRIDVDVQRMPHLQFFTFQITLVVFIGFDFNGHLFSNAEQVPIEVEANEYNKCYLECKKLKMGHTLNIDVNP